MSEAYQEVLDFATDILGSKEEATDWMEKKSNTLGDSPVNIIKTDSGIQKVLDHLKGISRHRQA